MPLSLTYPTLLGFVVLVAADPVSANPLIDDATLHAAGLTKSWQASLPIGDKDTVNAAYRVDEALYVVTDGGVFFSLTADVGLLRWAAKLTERNHTVFEPTHLRNADGTGALLIPTTTETFVYDRFSGDLLEHFVPAFPPGGAAVGYDNRLFMGGSNGRFYSLALGRPCLGRPAMRWEVHVGGPITATPVLYGGNKLLFASQSGVVYSCFAAGKGFDWAFRTNGSILGDPAVDESGVYVASFDRSLYKIHGGIGEALWRVRFPAPLAEGPIVAAHTVYQYCPDHGLTAIDADTGVENWHNADARALVAHSRDRDLLFTHDRNLAVVRHETGELLERVDAHRVAMVVSNPRDDAVFLLGPKGRVLCARMERVPYLRLQQVLSARRRLNLPPLDQTAKTREVSAAQGDKDDFGTSDPLRSRYDVDAEKK